jgi:hypothetical protein
MIDTWREAYRPLRAAADSARDKARNKARRLCAEAGLDPTLLGLHPHNALAALKQGQPWPGVDYGKVRRCEHALDNMFLASRVVDAWDRKVR